MKYTILILVLFILFLIIIILKIRNKNKYLLRTIYEYEAIIENQGKKNHEFNNQLLVLCGFLDDKKKLREYLNTIIEDYKTGQNYEIRQLSHLSNGGIKNLLYCKAYKMKKKNISFCPYIQQDTKKYIENLDLKVYKDVTKLLGVFMDNAIDAAILSEKKEIFLDITTDDKYLYIKITNSIFDKERISNIGKRKYTTKGKGHGYGLLIVKDIVKHNNKIEVVTDYDEKSFSQTILIDLR